MNAGRLLDGRLWDDMPIVCIEKTGSTRLTSQGDIPWIITYIGTWIAHGHSCNEEKKQKKKRHTSITTY